MNCWNNASELHTENIYQTVDPIVQETIALGDMPKIDALICNFTNIDGLLEFSIYDNKGMAAYSARRDILKSKKTLPNGFKSPTARQSGQSLRGHRRGIRDLPSNARLRQMR